MSGWWSLSDSELRSRLVQRGVLTEDAIALVAGRDDESAAELITEALER